MSDAIAKPSYDAWVGVDHEVLRFVQALEARITNLTIRLEGIDLEHREQIAERDRTIAAKDARIKRLEREVFLLREKVDLTSRNSSKPPSSDPPSMPKRPARERGKRSRGGQTGHAFHARPLVPADQVLPENIVDHRPQVCASCGHGLDGSDPAPTRHQIVDLPVPTPRVIEHRLHSVVCSTCGSATRAALADPGNAVGFGPGVEAVVATLWSACRLSHRMIVDTMRDLFGVEMAVGTVRNILDRVGRHVETPVEQARQHVKQAEAPKHVDETGWYNRGADGSNPKGRRAWLWVAATAAVVAFEVALSRSQAVAKTLLGAVVRGTVITDRYLGYRFVDLERRQLCWAHLYRDFVRISERRGESGTIGRQLVRVSEKLFRLWGRYGEGRLRQEIWEAETAALRFRMRGLLERASRFETRRDERSERTRTKNTCRELLEVEEAMWRFVSRPEVGMTNNLAERMLRHAVLWRRASFGSQSARGAELVALLLTVVMTRKAQGKSVHAFVLEACRAAREGRQAPALVDPSA